VRLTISEVLGLDNSAAQNVESGLVLRSKIGRSNPFGDITLDPGKGRPAGVIRLDKLAIVRRVTQVEPMVFEVWQTAERDSPKRLLSFACILDGRNFVARVAELVEVKLDPSANDALRAEAQRQFDDVDEDGSGYLDRDELRKQRTLAPSPARQRLPALSHWWPPPASSTAQAPVCLADRLSKILGAELGASELTESLSKMDEDNSGEVSFDEFYNWWQLHGKHEDGLGGMFKAQKEKTKAKSKKLGSRVRASSVLWRELCR
jgi:Ca2+-binding EF-hand superfamily protein